MVTWGAPGQVLWRGHMFRCFGPVCPQLLNSFRRHWQHATVQIANKHLDYTEKQTVCDVHERYALCSAWMICHLLQLIHQNRSILPVAASLGLNPTGPISSRCYVVYIRLARLGCAPFQAFLSCIFFLSHLIGLYTFRWELPNIWPISCRHWSIDSPHLHMHDFFRLTFSLRFLKTIVRDF